MNANQIEAGKLNLERRAIVAGGAAWWITGGELEEMGPYRTRADAQEDRAGVQRFLRNCHRRNFVTTQK